MLYLIMLILFFIQFLVVLGALILVIFFARPEVALLGHGPQECPAPKEGAQVSPRPPEGVAPTSGNNASRSLAPQALTPRFS
jgi:hypothetical protein